MCSIKRAKCGIEWKREWASDHWDWTCVDIWHSWINHTQLALASAATAYATVTDYPSDVATHKENKRTHTSGMIPLGIEWRVQQSGGHDRRKSQNLTATSQASRASTNFHILPSWNIIAFTLKIVCQTNCRSTWLPYTLTFYRPLCYWDWAHLRHTTNDAQLSINWLHINNINNIYNFK